ncbi:hypothetical protein [Gelatiniphilus marinus]|uniref:Uncharacterized protein n=1 Tax=Gelatiniphilus marinus TaxID=1759464 RepID=A0ABW5JSJ3_9FLAO
MKDSVTNPNLIRNSILLVFAMGIFADVQSKNLPVEDNNEFAYVDFQDKSLKSYTAINSFTTSKTNTCTTESGFNTKTTNTIFTFETAQNVKHLKTGLKVSLFILYSSLKISPLI